MDLIFTKTEDGRFEARHTVNADFNVHVEIHKGTPCSLVVNVSTVEDGEPVAAYSGNVSDVFDRDFDAIVYPKYVTIVTDQPVRRGVITEAT